MKKWLHKEKVKKTLSWIFGVMLQINAFFFIPQAIRIWQTQSAKDLSLVLFLWFELFHSVDILYGYAHKNRPLIWGGFSAFITCGAVIVLILYFS